MPDKKLQKTALKSLAKDLPIEVLDPVHSAQYYSLVMPKPDEALKDIIDHYWIMRWDVPAGTSFTAEIIPSPYINLTFMENGAQITGVTTGKYTHEVVGKGIIIGVKFLPGGYYCVSHKDASSITDKVIPASHIFPEATEALNAKILNSKSDKASIRLIENLLCRYPYNVDDNLKLVITIINDIRDTERLSVKSIVDDYNISERRLQELFKKYVGVSPKWVMLRYRLIKAISVATNEKDQSWAHTASELGYNDQSHFINDFKRIIGVTPNEYSSIAKPK